MPNPPSCPIATPKPPALCSLGSGGGGGAREDRGGPGSTRPYRSVFFTACGLLFENWILQLFCCSASRLQSHASSMSPNSAKPTRLPFRSFRTLVVCEARTVSDAKGVELRWGGQAQDLTRCGVASSPCIPCTPGRIHPGRFPGKEISLSRSLSVSMPGLVTAVTRRMRPLRVQHIMAYS